MIAAAETMKERIEIPSEDQWNVGALYPSFQAWEKELSAVCESSGLLRTGLSYKNIAGRLKESEGTCKEALDFSLALSRKLEKLYTYAHLRHDEEITQDAHKAAFQRISSLLYDFQQECAWIEPEILELPSEVIQKLSQLFFSRAIVFISKK